VFYPGMSLGHVVVDKRLKSVKRGGIH